MTEGPQAAARAADPAQGLGENEEYSRQPSVTICPRCLGTGDVGGNHERVWAKCPECEGMGEIE